jgi:hypothetical protein
VDEDRRRYGGLAILLAAVLAALAAAVLVVSPASFVGLLPGWFTEGASTAWIVAGFSAATAAVLAIPRGRGRGLRGVLITFLLVIALGAGVQAVKAGAAEEQPAPENTCVAYSGGRHTCPGG